MRYRCSVSPQSHPALRWSLKRLQHPFNAGHNRYGRQCRFRTIWRNRSTIRGSRHRNSGVNHRSILASARLPCRSRAHSRYDCPKPRAGHSSITRVSVAHFGMIAANNALSAPPATTDQTVNIQYLAVPHPLLVGEACTAVAAAGTVSALFQRRTLNRSTSASICPSPGRSSIDCCSTGRRADQLKRPSIDRTPFTLQWHVAPSPY